MTVLERVNVLLHILAKIAVFWIANITAALMGIAVLNFQLLDVCARMDILASARTNHHTLLIHHLIIYHFRCETCTQGNTVNTWSV